MSGIVGIISKNEHELKNIDLAAQVLSNDKKSNHRKMSFGKLSLAHVNPSITATEKVIQPFSDLTKRYTIAFDGIIYNFLELKEELISEGVSFNTNSDTEVLLYWYIKHKKKCLEKLNGDFAFAIYDTQEKSLFIARDKMGGKPLLYCLDKEQLIFSSTLKSLLKFNIDKQIDKVSLFNYLQFNYIPTHNSIITSVKKLKPGHFIAIDNINALDGAIKEEMYYEIPFHQEPTIQTNAVNYDKSQEILRNLLDDAVKKRLVSDTTSGVFLNGGISTSIINLIAKNHFPNLPTFSVEFEGKTALNQTKNTRSQIGKTERNHHTFSLSNHDLHEDLTHFLNEYDEPFADLSTFSLYLLSKRANQHSSFVLTGFGAKQMFAGQDKHVAEFKLENAGFKESVIKLGHPLWQTFPKSSTSRITNINRKLHKFSLGSKLPSKLRYWEWTSTINEERANYLLKEELVFNPQRLSDTAFEYKKRKDEILKHIRKDGNINDVLKTDMRVILSNNMLSQLNVINRNEKMEINSPYLDHRLVNFAFSLPVAFKINPNTSMKILYDAFQTELPNEEFEHSTHKLEVLLLDWLRNEFQSTIEDDLLSDKFIENQGLFNVSAIQTLKKELFSNNPNGVQKTIWALIVFNTWWKKYLME